MIGIWFLAALQQELDYGPDPLPSSRKALLPCSLQPSLSSACPVSLSMWPALCRRPDIALRPPGPRQDFCRDVTYMIRLHWRALEVYCPIEVD